MIVSFGLGLVTPGCPAEVAKDPRCLSWETLHENGGRVQGARGQRTQLFQIAFWP